MAENETTADPGKTITHTQPPPGSKCSFCRVGDENELAFGKMYQLEDIITHYYCLLLSSNMDQQGDDDEGVLGFLYPDVLKELKRGNRLVCVYCKRNGATIGCCASRCKKVFHLPCGYNKGSLHQFFGQFKSFCRDHRLIQKIPPKIVQSVSHGDVNCPICLDNVDPKSVVSTIWAPCCKKNAWFHRNCLQSLAISAGYFFKCPLCCDNKIFQKAMMDYGIFIPEQDASWERVPDAFQELLQRPNQCDAHECKCPRGRDVNDKGTRFELVMCNLCGGQASHIYCSHLQWCNPQYACDTCYKWADSPHQFPGDDGDEESEEDEQLKNSEDDKKDSNEEKKTALEEPMDTDVKVDVESIDEEPQLEYKEAVKVTLPSQSQPLSPVRLSEGPSQRTDVTKSEVLSVKCKDSPPIIPTAAVEELIILSDSDDEEIQVIDSPGPIQGELLAADGSKIPVLRFNIPLNPTLGMHIEGDVKVRTEIIDIESPDEDVKFEGYSPGVPGFKNRCVSIRPVINTPDFGSKVDMAQPIPQAAGQLAGNAQMSRSTGHTLNRPQGAEKSVENTKQIPTAIRHQHSFTSTHPEVARRQISNQSVRRQLIQNSPQSPHMSTVQNQHSSTPRVPVSSQILRSSLQHHSSQKPLQTEKLTQQHLINPPPQKINSITQQSSQQKITSPQSGNYTHQMMTQQSPQRKILPQTGRPLQQQVHDQQVPRRRLSSGRSVRQQPNIQQMAQNTTQQTTQQMAKCRTSNQTTAHQLLNNIIVKQLATPSSSQIPNSRGQYVSNISHTQQPMNTTPGVQNAPKLPSQEYNIPKDNRRLSQSQHRSPAAAGVAVSQNSQLISQSQQQYAGVSTNHYSRKQQTHNRNMQHIQQVVSQSGQKATHIQQDSGSQAVDDYHLQENLSYSQPPKKVCYPIPRTDNQENQTIFNNAGNYIGYSSKPPPSYEEATQYAFNPNTEIQSLLTFHDGTYLTDNGSVQQGVVTVPNYTSGADPSGAQQNLITVQNYSPDSGGQSVITYNQSPSYLPEAVSSKQNVLVHPSMGTLLTVNSTPQTQFYLSTQPHGPAVIQNYINTMPQQQYVDGAYSGTPRYGRVQRSNHSPSTAAITPSSNAAASRLATCFGPYIAAEAPACQTKPRSGYPRLRKEPMSGVVLEILGTSHVNVHLSGKFLGNLKLTYPSVTTNDPRIVNAAKEAYKRSVSWGQHKSRGSYKKQKIAKSETNPTGNQLGMQSGRNNTYTSKGGKSQNGHVQSSKSNSQQKHSQTSAGNSQQGYSHSSSGNSKWSRSRSSSSDSQQNYPQRLRNMNDDSQWIPSRSSSRNSQRNHSRSTSRDSQLNRSRSSSRNSQRNRSRSLSRGSQLNRSQSSSRTSQRSRSHSLSRGLQLNCSPSSSRNSHRSRSRSLSRGSQLNHSPSSSRNSRRSRSHSLSRGSQQNRSRSLSNRDSNRSQSLSGDSWQKMSHSSRASSRHKGGVDETIFTKSLPHREMDLTDSVRLAVNAKRSTGTRKRKSSAWSKGVVVARNRKPTRKKSNLVEETHYVSIHQVAMVNTPPKKYSTSNETTSVGPPVKRIRPRAVSNETQFSVTNTSPITRSKFFTNRTLTRSTMSMKHFTFKMGAKNSLNASDLKKSSKKKDMIISSVNSNEVVKAPSPSLPQQSVSRTLKESKMGQHSSSDASIENLDVVSVGSAPYMEVNDLSSESGNSDYSSSRSCESWESVGVPSDILQKSVSMGIGMTSGTLQRSVSMETLYSHSSYFDSLSSKNHIRDSGNGMSSIGSLTSRVPCSNSSRNIENDDSSHSESDIAFPVFCRQKLNDKLVSESEVPKRIIKFKVLSSSDSEDTSDPGSLTLSLECFQTRFQRSGSVESEVCSQTGHVSRRDQANLPRSESKLTKEKSSSGSSKNKDPSKSPLNVNRECIRTRSRAANDLIRTRSQHRTLSRSSSFTQLSYDTLKVKSTKKTTPKKTRGSSEPRLRRSVSLSSLEMIRGSRFLDKRKFEDLSLSTIVTNNSKPQSLNNNSKTGHFNTKLKSKANVPAAYIRTRRRSLIETRSRSRSLSNLNKSSHVYSSLYFSRSKDHNAKKVSQKKDAKFSGTKMRRSSSMSRFETSSNCAVINSYDYSFFGSKVSSLSSQLSNPIRMYCKHQFQENSSGEIRTCNRSASQIVETRTKTKTLSHAFYNKDSSSLLTKPLLQKAVKLSTRKNPLRRCTSLSTIESSLMRGLVHESDLDSLSDASSATSSRVASLKAGALTARKFRPPSQHEIEQRKLLQNLQWYSNFH